MNTQSINELLEVVEACLKKFRADQEQLDRSEAPRFSAFTYIKPGEVRLFRIIKDLLDPKGANGQGRIFLKAFLDRLRLVGAESVQRAEVEEPTSGTGSNRRLHDIFLDASDWVLSIENKPWAEDQTNQVQDYLEDLSRRQRPNWYLVYLTKDGRPPSGKSIRAAECKKNQEEGHLILLSFERLRDWLEDCSEKCEAPRVTEFLKDFRQYIHEQLLGFAPEEEQTMIVKAVLDSNHLAAALELLRSADRLYDELLRRAMGAITAGLPSDWEVADQLKIDNYRLALKLPNSQGWTICFQDETVYRNKWDNWIYGIKYDDDVEKDAQKKASLASLKLAMENQLGAIGGKDYGSWLWYRYFDGQGEQGEHAIADYRNKCKTRLWVDMRNGKFATHIVNLAKILYKALNSCSL